MLDVSAPSRLSTNVGRYENAVCHCGCGHGITVRHRLPGLHSRSGARYSDRRRAGGSPHASRSADFHWSGGWLLARLLLPQEVNFGMNAPTSRSTHSLFGPLLFTRFHLSDMT